MTNTYNLPERVALTRIRTLNTLKASMHVFFITNFHCNRMLQMIPFVSTDEGYFSIGSIGDIGL